MRFSLLALGLLVGASTSAFAGGAGPGSHCSNYVRKLVGSELVSSKDDNLVMKVELFYHSSFCENRWTRAVTVHPQIIWAKDGKVPNGGYLSGVFKAMDEYGNTIAEKSYPGSFFVVSDHPFPDSTSKVLAWIEGFRPFTVERVR